ncbi:MAG TPA: hypothetical protein VE842_19795 [Pyrinomonadaceae bacterium]|nr:hypothetical protein [Pyrinomonadaceae bacterium]
MFRRLFILTLMLTFLAAAGPLSGRVLAADDDKKSFTAEQLAENVVLIYGSRAALQQIRRNGIERGRVTRINPDGRTEESSYERRFMRGESTDKDRVRLDQKLPTVEYALIYGSGNTFGLINGSAFTPRQEATVDFYGQMWHDIDALLRYKENGSTLTLVGKDKQKNLDLHVLDVTDKEKRRTRYYISARTGRILWLEYEDTPAGASAPVKYTRKFHDYRYAQGTLVPYRTVLYENDKLTQETRILTVTYGVKMEEALFNNPEAPASTSANP